VPALGCYTLHTTQGRALVGLRLHSRGQIEPATPHLAEVVHDLPRI